MEDRAADRSRILAALDELRRRRPDEPGTWTPGAVLSETAIAAEEARLGVTLPPGYRAYLQAVGDGGLGLDTVTALADVEPDPRSAQPFPLRGAWCDPAEHNVAYFRQAGIYDAYASRFVALPDGARPTDGTLAIGATRSHDVMRLVLTGPHAGEIWIDSTGNDGGGVAPAEPAELCAWHRAVLEGRLASVRRADELAARVAEGTAAAWLAGLDGATQDELRRELLASARSVLRAALAADPVDRARAATAADMFELAGARPQAINAWLAAAAWDRAAARVDAALAADAPELSVLVRDSYRVLAVLLAPLRTSAAPAPSVDAGVADVATISSVWQDSRAWRALVALSPPERDVALARLHPLLALGLVSDAALAGPPSLLAGVVARAADAIAAMPRPPDYLPSDGIEAACDADPELRAAVAEPLLDLFVLARRSKKALAGFLDATMPGRFADAEAARAHVLARRGRPA